MNTSLTLGAPIIRERREAGGVITYEIGYNDNGNSAGSVERADVSKIVHQFMLLLTLFIGVL